MCANVLPLSPPTTQRLIQNFLLIHSALKSSNQPLFTLDHYDRVNSLVFTSHTNLCVAAASRPLPNIRLVALVPICQPNGTIPYVLVPQIIIAEWVNTSMIRIELGLR
jgi:hypothetical protein